MAMPFYQYTLQELTLIMLLLLLTESVCGMLMKSAIL